MTVRWFDEGWAMAVPRKSSKKSASPVAASASSPSSLPEVKLHDPDIMKRIAETAYYLWEKRGRPTGSDLQDWVEAEKIVLGKK